MEKQSQFKELIKPLLKNLLVDNPPKRVNGESSWITDLHKELAKVGAISGGVSPCCEKWCDTDAPCGVDANATTEDINKELIELINNL